MRQALLSHSPLPLRILLLRPGTQPPLATPDHPLCDHHRQPAWQRRTVQAQHRRNGNRCIGWRHPLGERPQQHMPAHAMRHHRAWPATLRPPIVGQGAQVGDIIGEIVDVPAEQVIRQTPRPALPAPIETGDGPAARRPMGNDLQIFFDHVAAPAHDEHAPARAAAQLVTANRPAVRRGPIVQPPAHWPGAPVQNRCVEGRSRRKGRIHEPHGYGLVSHQV